MIADHKEIDSPIGDPVMRSLAKPSGAAHHAGHASALSNLQASSIRRPTFGHQPVADTIGRSENSEPPTTDSAGI
jgi:hypothetical protein